MTPATQTPDQAPHKSSLGGGPLKRLKRLAATLSGHLHERAMLQPELTVVGLLLAKRAQGCDLPLDWAFIQEIRERNTRRVAELENRKINRVVFAGRALVQRLPPWAEAALKGLAREAIRVLRGRGFVRTVRPPPPPNLAVAVPFGPGFPKPAGAEPLAVVMHLYYPELAPEIRGYLRNIPGRSDLHVSTDSEAKAEKLREAFAGWPSGAVEVRLAPNRGRDIAPKLLAFRDVHARYPLVLHLHGKKSPHDSYLRLWRYHVLETLIGDAAVAGGIRAALEHEPLLGLVAAEHYFAVAGNISWSENLKPAQGLARRMGFSIDPAGPLDFPSGSMFWAKSAALKPLLDLDLRPEDFPPETGQTDGTLAHAVERLYFHACEAAGLRWLTVSRPELAQHETRRPPPIGDLEDLRRRLTADFNPLSAG